MLDVLDDEDGMSDSNLLKDMCRQIDRALPRTKVDGLQLRPAGNQPSQEKLFEKYLKQEEARLKGRQRIQPREDGEHKQRRRMDLEQLLRKRRQDRYGSGKGGAANTASLKEGLGKNSTANTASLK